MKALSSWVFPPWLLAPVSLRHRSRESAGAAELGLLNPPLVTARFQQLARDAGLPRIRLHDLRHSWATLALENGLSVKVVQQRLGHASASITLNVYSHVSPEHAAEAAEQLGGLMFGDSGGGAGS